VKNSYLGIIIGITAAIVVFAILWRKGQFATIANYVRETKEELRKCSWPSVDELKGSTVVVLVALALLGGFTVTVDFVVAMMIRWIT
jgi:preprotein translocase subunit SecE